MPKTATTSNILAGSYTKETAGNLLRKNGVRLRHKEVKKELLSDNSVYKLMMHLPALAIHNESLMRRVTQAKEYVQEQLTNVVFAVTAVRAKDPSNKKPLSERRQALYDDIQERSNTEAKTLYHFTREHDEHYQATLEAFKQAIKEWRVLCRKSAREITNNLLDKGHELPDDFMDVLQKHLERAGSHEISANELGEMNIKPKPGHADLALICALKEVEK